MDALSMTAAIHRHASKRLRISKRREKKNATKPELKS
jgi:hypothetical protein